ncbi:ATP synthase F1 subunit delta [Aerosakkonema funiforme]|uniref:ATP synthase subunit delta n=1 Tax=Aerosakkonema funiforme FACHB-1375 TaxID=2949571 RepID=A0A926VEW7_9CYAN|nr:ATP synthase F1 subunit delta [Aerosakkonema funiforme]MBD2182310.1 F0F1 ATP synthase subunit delta [Aerosakkonema funiforme FACHB-1375]
MKGSLISAEVLEPYAEALMSVAQSHNQVDKIGEDVSGLLSLLQSSPELGDFLSNPIIEAEAKKAVLQQLVGEQVHPYTMNILKLLVDRRRIMFLQGICEHFQDLLRQIKQTALAEVTSAVELSEAQRQAIVERVKALSGAQQVELKTEIDRDLIGGVIIKVGSQVLDASLRGQLRRIGMRLSAG